MESQTIACLVARQLRTLSADGLASIVNRTLSVLVHTSTKLLFEQKAIT